MPPFVYTCSGMLSRRNSALSRDCVVRVAQPALLTHNFFTPSRFDMVAMRLPCSNRSRLRVAWLNTDCVLPTALVSPLMNAPITSFSIFRIAVPLLSNVLDVVGRYDLIRTLVVCDGDGEPLLIGIVITCYNLRL